MQTVSFAVIFILGGFIFSLFVSSNTSILLLTSSTNINNCIRFDSAKALLCLDSDIELIEFSKVNHINVYFSDAKIESKTANNLSGKIDTTLNSFFNIHIVTQGRIKRAKAFFDKDEFDAVVEKYIRSFQISDPDDLNNRVKSLEKTVSDLLEDKAKKRINLKIAEEKLRAANARAAKAWEGKKFERSLRALSIRVAARLGILHAGERVFTKSQVQAVLDDVLRYEEESCNFSIDAPAVPKGFAEQLLAVLPPEMQNGRGRPKKS
jgi:hypothetical protein